SGILNIGIEGMMLVGAAVGFAVAVVAGHATLGVAAAMAASGLMALVLAYGSVDLRGSQITIGLGLFVLGLGLSSLLCRVVFGVRLPPPRVATLPPLAIPGLGDVPVVGAIFFRQNALVYAAVLLVPSVHLLLFRTPLGLRLRAAGENPRAVDTLGVDVFALRRGGAGPGGPPLRAPAAHLPLPRSRTPPRTT